MNETRCPNYWAAYCEAHDYDHVLERRERSTPPAPAEVEVDRAAITVHEGRMVAEASELRLPPGSWPETLVVADREGGRRWFRRGRFEYGNDDLVAVYYRSEDLVLAILND